MDTPIELPSSDNVVDSEDCGGKDEVLDEVEDDGESVKFNMDDVKGGLLDKDACRVMLVECSGDNGGETEESC